MKKRNFALAFVLAALLVACGGNEPDPKAMAPSGFSCKIDGVKAPEWVCGNFAKEGFYTATGSAPKSALGINFQRREAITTARAALSQQIQTEIKDKVDNFMSNTGVGNKAVADKVTTQVTKQVAQVTLKGSKQVQLWQQPDNKELFVLVAIPEDAINGSAIDTVKSSYKNDNALWQQFQAKNALEELEKEFK